MRLSVTVEPQLYDLAKALAKAQDVSLSTVINQKLREALLGKKTQAKSYRKNGLLVSRSKVTVTSEMVQRVLEEDE
jgi:hypothetical protein